MRALASRRLWERAGTMLFFEIAGGLFILLLLAPILSGHETVSR